MEKREKVEINLPQTLKYEIDLFGSSTIDFSDNDSLLDKVKIYIEDNLILWDLTKSQNFEFNMPTTLFNDRVEIRYKGYNEYEVAYLGSEQMMNGTQLSEIWKNGQFTIESNIPDLPYTWKLTQWTVKGMNNIADSFYYDLSLAFKALYTIKNRFMYTNTFNYSITNSIVEIFKGLESFIGIIIGTSRKNENYDYQQSLLQIVGRKFYEKLLESLPNLDLSLYFVYKKQILEKLQVEFDSNWVNEVIALEQNLFDDDEINPSTISKILAKARYKNLFNHFEKTNKLDDRSKQMILQILKAYIRIVNEEFKFNKLLNEEKLKIKNAIVSEHCIRSQVEEWCSKEEIQRLEPIEKILINDKTTNSLTKLDKFPICKIIYTENNIFNENKERLMKEDENLPNLPEKYVASFEFNFQRWMFPPFEIKRNEIDNKYYLERYSSYKCHSKYIFWRIWLILMRYYIWSNNVALILFNVCWNSSFGLKALCAEKVYLNYACDADTGLIYPIDEGFTYRSAIYSLFAWISQSREDFENSPDTGIFGKNFARLFNLINNYFIKLLILGMFIFFLYPIAIILFSILSLFLGITAWIWIILVVFIVHIFNILIYDFDSYEVCSFFPIIRIVVYEILIKGVLQMLLFLIVTICHPILIVIFLIWAFFRVTLRFLYDCFMYCFVRCCARIPRSDTAIAWKISGPGLSRNYYIHVSMEDAILLIRAKLESIEIDQYRDKVHDALNLPQAKLDTKISNYFKNVNLSFRTDNKINDSIQKYKELISNQVIDRKGLFPTSPNNVKFNEQELIALTNGTKELIKSYLNEKDMDFIWNKYSLLPNSWNRLAEKILTEVFGNEIHISLGEMDFRIELEKEFNSALEITKERIFKGNLNLNRLFKVEKCKVKVNDAIPETVDVYFINSDRLLSIKVDFLPIKLNKKLTKEDKDKYFL